MRCIVLFVMFCLLSCAVFADEERPADDGKEGSELRLVIMGPPGAGKGTQAEKISKQYGIAHISTGAILRAEVAKGSKLGHQVEETMKKGELVTDDTVLRLVEERLRDPDCRDGFILDGFPRTIAQAEGLEKILERQHRGPVSVIDLVVPDEALSKRLLARGRADDTEETIKNRIRVYHENTAPLIAYYKKRGQLIRVNGDQPIADVFSTIMSELTPPE